MSCVMLCGVHGIYFRTDDNICPLCLEEWTTIEDSDEKHDELYDEAEGA